MNLHAETVAVFEIARQRALAAMTDAQAIEAEEFSKGALFGLRLGGTITDAEHDAALPEVRRFIEDRRCMLSALRREAMRATA